MMSYRFVIYRSNFGIFFCKQKTAYEMRISDWSSDVCSSDLGQTAQPREAGQLGQVGRRIYGNTESMGVCHGSSPRESGDRDVAAAGAASGIGSSSGNGDRKSVVQGKRGAVRLDPGGRRRVKTKK